jgi:hypothetical protein
VVLGGLPSGSVLAVRVTRYMLIRSGSQALCGAVFLGDSLSSSRAPRLATIGSR